MNVDQPREPKFRRAYPNRFSHPGEVVSSLVMAREEKSRLLLQWLEDERALVVAGDEGMPEGRPSQLDQVFRALRALERGQS
jgi:hypothetical protein